MTAGQSPGDNVRFPGYDVLRRSDQWDQVTTGVVLRRLGPLPSLRFFTVEEEPTARALLDRLLGNDHEPRLPLLALLDSLLTENKTDGWRHEDMPEDRDAWKATLQFLDQDAQTLHHARFHELAPLLQSSLIESVHTGDVWHGVSADHVWSLWTRYGCKVFYSHPRSWNEIGFGGPAYPVGYAHLGLDGLEHWETRDVGEQDPPQSSSGSTREDDEGNS